MSDGSFRDPAGQLGLLHGVASAVFPQHLAYQGRIHVRQVTPDPMCGLDGSENYDGVSMLIVGPTINNQAYPCRVDVLEAGRPFDGNRLQNHWLIS